jgi:hypothetical protein
VITRRGKGKGKGARASLLLFSLTFHGSETGRRQPPGRTRKTAFGLSSVGLYDRVPTHPIISKKFTVFVYTDTRTQRTEESG